MMVKSARKLRDLNRKQRSKMSASGKAVGCPSVIIQRGVYTFEHWGETQNTKLNPSLVHMIDNTSSAVLSFAQRP